LSTTAWNDHSHFAQLHQWVLWHQKLELPRPVPSALHDRCLAALRDSQRSSSQAQHEVAVTLTMLGVKKKSFRRVTASMWLCGWKASGRL